VSAMNQAESLPNEFRELNEAFAEELDRLAATEKQERRQAPRRAFPAIQAIAPYDGSSMPEPGMFRPTRCYDLSRVGSRFFGPPSRPPVRGHPPEEPAILVDALGEVARREPVAGLNNEYLVCCRFIGRIKPE